MADIAGDTSTTSVLTGTGVFTSTLESSGDRDWWRINTVAGLRYDFTVSGDGSATSLDDSNVRIRDSFGQIVVSDYGYDGGISRVSFTATSSGPYYLEISDEANDGAAEGSYVVTARMSDRVVNNAATTRSIVNGINSGALEASGDSDWYKVKLIAGQRVDFTIGGDGSSKSLDDANIYLLDQNGATIVQSYTSDGGTTWISATAAQSGTYFIAVADNSGDELAEGNYRVNARLTDRITGDSSTSATISDGMTFESRIDARGDADWIKLSAVAGRAYSFTLSGDGSSGALDDKSLTLRDANGDSISSDYSYSGGSVTINWVAAGSGTVYLDARGYSSSSDTGDYRLTAISNKSTLTGTSGADVLTGGANNTKIVGRAGNDRLDGGAGNDVLLGGEGNDRLIGGSGRDTAVFTTTASVRANLLKGTASGEGSDILSGIENLTTGSGADILTGNSADNRLVAGAGRDVLIAGAGEDVLTGGSGADKFVFDNSDRTDRITDFQDGVDRIQIGGAADAFRDLDIRDTSSGCRIDWDAGTTILLTGVSESQLSAADFIFV